MVNSDDPASLVFHACMSLVARSHQVILEETRFLYYGDDAQIMNFIREEMACLGDDMSPLQKVRLLREDTLTNFIAQNANSRKVADMYPIPAQYTIISAEDYRDIIGRDNSGWGRFYERFPNTNGVLEVSQIGFDSTQTQALICSGSMHGGCVGHGRNYLYQLTGDSWEFVGSGLAWIS